MPHIILHTFPGESIVDVADAMSRVAKINGVTARCEYDRVILFAKPGDIPENIIIDYHRRKAQG